MQFRNYNISIKTFNANEVKIKKIKLVASPNGIERKD